MGSGEWGRRNYFTTPHSPLPTLHSPLPFFNPRSSRLYNPLPRSSSKSTFDIKGDSMASISFKGNLVTLAGAEVKAGQDAPDFRLQKVDMSDYTLASGAGKTRIIAAVDRKSTRLNSSRLGISYA